MKKPEILAPAGNMESLRAAAAGGADAVYFGGRSFNARRNADNFEDLEIPRAVAFCHARSMKAYITLNTVVFGRELQDAMNFVSLICDAGADAVILQDLGLVRLIRKAAPSLRLHASTQMSVHNLEGVRMAQKMGFSRVVLARELSRQELEGIAREAGIELEVFVHGALCMSVSGQCYLSAMLGGRSGNRGLCAQPCRLPFSAPGGTGYDLSLKDSSLISKTGELAGMGIASLKIEGRMKRPEYVYAASHALSEAVSGKEVPESELSALQNVFSRSGFTAGYYEGKTGRGMFGTRGREDVMATHASLREMKIPQAETPRVKVFFRFTAESGKPSALNAADEDGHSVTVEGKTPEKARTVALSESAVAESLSKTGGTPFYAVDLQALIGEGLSLPVSELNRMRREALGALLEKRMRPEKIGLAMPSFSTKRAETVENRCALRIRLSCFEQFTPDIEKCGAELVFLPAGKIAANPKRAGELIKSGLRLGAELPRAVFGRHDRLDPIADACAEAGVKDFLCGGLGQIGFALSKGYIVHGDFGLNLTNAEAVEEISGLGISSCVLSFENTLGTAALASAGGPGRCGLIAYGFLPLMLLRNCPLKNGAGCSKCPGFLRDRLGNLFPVACGGQASELLNDRPLWLCDRREELRQTGVHFAVLRFTNETPAETDAVLKAWKEGLPAPGEFTRGLTYRGVD